MYITRSGTHGEETNKNVFFFSKGTRGRIGIAGTAPGSAGGRPGAGGVAGFQRRGAVAVYARHAYIREADRRSFLSGLLFPPTTQPGKSERAII